MIEIKYPSNNPWPEPKEILDSCNEVIRTWSVQIEKKVLSSEITKKLNESLSDDINKVIVLYNNVYNLSIQIRSPHPDKSDPLQVIVGTSKILKRIDKQFGILNIQGIEKKRWLIMK